MNTRPTTNIFRKPALLLIGTVLILTGWLLADTQVSISLSENMGAIGDRIRVKLVIKTTQPADHIGVKPGAGEFEILSQTDTVSHRQNEYRVFEKTLELAFFKTGEFTVGPFAVELKQKNTVMETRDTNSVPVTIKTVLTDDDKDIKPLKPPLEIEGNPLFLLKYVLPVLAAVGALLFIIWYLRRRRKKAQTRAPLLSPLEEFEKSFLALAARDFPAKGRIKEYFIELTLIIKRFMNRHYSFNAEDLTTSETAARLRELEHDPGVLDVFSFMMNTADLVKFARFAPDGGVFNEINNKLNLLLAEYRKREQALKAEVKK